MILYHGSYLTVERPDISFSRINVDFGKGFYTTPIKEQAKSWADRFKNKHGQSVVSMYEFDEAAMMNNKSILEFKDYSDEWLDFIVSCRQGNNAGEYDIITGGVANDKVFNTIELFFDGFIDKSEAIKRLCYEEPNLQYCFRSQETIDQYLKFISSEVW